VVTKEFASTEKLIVSLWGSSTLYPFVFVSVGKFHTGYKLHFVILSRQKK